MDPTAPDLAPFLARESRLADLGELAGPLIHEVNNYLNNLTLHLALLQQQTPGGLSDDLQSLRRQAGHVSLQVQRFQRHRQNAAPTASDVDLNRELTQAAQELAVEAPPGPNRVPVTVRFDDAPAPGVSIQLRLADGAPKVRGPLADIRRLCRFLLRNGVRAAAPIVQAAVSVQCNEVVLTVEDNGASLPPVLVPRIFEPGQECRDGMCCLELAACQSIVRRLHGRIEARPRAGGGLTLAVTLPAESAT